MRPVNRLDLLQQRQQQRPDTDDLAVWLQRLAGEASSAANKFADAAGSLALAFNAAIHIWQDFDDTAPLRPASGDGDRIVDWLGPVRHARLREIAQRVRAAAGQLTAVHGGVHGLRVDGDVGVGIATAQAQLAAGASPTDAARAAIARLTARLVHARALANGIAAEVSN